MTKVKMGRMFVARYLTSCSACDNPIQPTQLARADGRGQWLHARHTLEFKIKATCAVIVVLSFLSMCLVEMVNT